MKPSSGLQDLFYPRKIAVIGATGTPGRVGGIIFNRLKCSPAELIPVHPNEEEVFGVRTVSSVEGLPEGVDLAL